MHLNIKKLLVALVLLAWPVLSLAQGVRLDNPLQVSSPVEIFARIVTALVFFTGILAIVFFVLGGFRILTAAGNEEKFAKGKTILLYSVIGFIATISSYYILAQVIDILTGGVITSFEYSRTIINPLNLFPTKPTAAFEFYSGRILGTLISLIGVVAVLVFIYAGFLWMTASGNEEKIAKAKQTMIYAVIGIAAVFGSYTALNFVYRPVYDILNSGNLPPSAEEAPAPKGACFVNGQCAEETITDCTAKNGQYYTNITCSEIGCCRQTHTYTFPYPPPTSQNKVRSSNCSPTLFSAVLPAIAGSCGMSDPQNAFVNISNSCYLKTEFVAGKDCVGL